METKYLKTAKGILIPYHSIICFEKDENHNMKIHYFHENKSKEISLTLDSNDLMVFLNASEENIFDLSK